MTAKTAETSLAREYMELTKPRVQGLLIFTAVIGMFMATKAMVPWDILLFATVGIGLASSSAAVINQLIERESDAHMARTEDRPLVTGRIPVAHATWFAGVMGVVSMLMLYLLVNPLTALLTFVSLIGYALVYTAFLKRATSQNIVIGGAAGAAPPLLGWVAVTGSVDAGGLLLFLIIFIWTPPHFWALAIHRRDEYALVDVPMLPVTHGIPYTRVQILLYTILLVLISIFPFLIKMSGLVYLLGALSLGAIYLYYAVILVWKPDAELPMRMFWYSIIYLMALFFFMLVDHYLPSRGWPIY